MMIKYRKVGASWARDGDGLIGEMLQETADDDEIERNIYDRQDENGNRVIRGMDPLKLAMEGKPVTWIEAKYVSN